MAENTLISKRYNVLQEPLKCWLVLKEDLKYSSERLLNIGVSSMCSEFNSSTRKQWMDTGSHFSTYFILNTEFLYNIESYLIENGIFFKWIEGSNKNPVGILIEPSSTNFRKTILHDCMTLKEYAKNRQKEFSDLIPRKE